MTQVDRLISFLRSHPEATSLEVTLACRIVNVTGRVSDARAQGIDIVCAKRSDGEFGYTVRDHEHVKKDLRAGKRADSTPDRMVTLCWAANNRPPTKLQRAAFREYLAAVGS